MQNMQQTTNENATSKRPLGMRNDVFKALTSILESPWYKWHKACGMRRPWLPWKIMRFKHYVDVTKMAIRETLSDKFYPRQAIPNVRVEKINDAWSLDVQIWGHPDIQNV